MGNFKIFEYYSFSLAQASAFNIIDVKDSVQEVVKPSTVDDKFISY
jgi:hypothetical protein